MSKGFLYDTGDELITREDVNEVPDSSTAHAGDVLGLDSNKKPKWTTPESGLPDTTSASEGDVLSLDEDKSPVWSAPSGGGGGGAMLKLDPDNAQTATIGGETYTLVPVKYACGSSSNPTYLDILQYVSEGCLSYIMETITEDNLTLTGILPLVLFGDSEDPIGDYVKECTFTDGSQILHIYTTINNDELYQIYKGTSPQ